MVMPRLGKEDGCIDPKYCISIEPEEGQPNDLTTSQRVEWWPMQCGNPPQIGSPGPGPVRDPLAGAPKTDFWSFRQLVTLCFASYTELSKNIFLKSRFSNLLTFVSRPAAERNIYFFADHRCSSHPDTNPKPPTMRLGLIFTAAPLFTPRLPPQRRG